MRVWCALLALLALSAAGWASPFATVPAGHWAYAQSAYLARLGLISSSLDFSGKEELSRYEFSVALAEPVDGLQRVEAKGDAVGQEMKDRLARLTATDRRKVGAALVRLIEEFKDGLAFLDQKTDPALPHARALARGDYPSWLEHPVATAHNPTSLVTGAATGPGTVSYSLGSGRVAVAYSETRPEDASLGSMGLNAPGNGNRLRLPNLALERESPVAVRDPMVRSLRGSLEYGLTDHLTLDLAYERMVKEGRGLITLDTTYLKTLGLGYRLSPSASLRLRYHIVDYQEGTLATPRYEDRLAEGRLLVRF